MTGPDRRGGIDYSQILGGDKRGIKDIAKDIRFSLSRTLDDAKMRAGDFFYNLLQKMDSMDDKSKSSPYRYRRKYGLKIPKESVTGKHYGKRVNWKTAAEYDYIKSLSNGSFLVRVGEKYGLVDNKGKKITKLEYDDVVVEKVNFESDDLLVVTKKGEKGPKKGVINDKGEKVIPLEFEDLEVVECENKIFFVVTVGDKKGVMDKFGNWVIKPEYNDIKAVTRYNYEKNCEEMSFIVTTGDKEGKKGVINDRGDIVIPVQCDEIFVPFRGIIGNMIFVVKELGRYRLSSFDGTSIGDTRKYEKYQVNDYGLHHQDNNVTLISNDGQTFTYFQFGDNGIGDNGKK